MNENIIIVAIILFMVGVVLEILATYDPKRHITGDFSKLLCSGQYEMAVRYIMGSNKKKLARELKWIMKDAEKKDRKGVLRENGVGTNQKSRFLFAYNLYTMFVGKLKVKQSYLDLCELSDEHQDYIDHLKKCIRD
jgi:hypothetical protein